MVPCRKMSGGYMNRRRNVLDEPAVVCILSFVAIFCTQFDQFISQCVSRSLGFREPWNTYVLDQKGNPVKRTPHLSDFPLAVQTVRNLQGIWIYLDDSPVARTSRTTRKSVLQSEANITPKV